MQFERWFTVNIDAGRATAVDLGPVLYEGDIDPLKIGVRLVNSEGDVSIQGNAAARCITADGRTLTPLESGKSGNAAWLIVPQDALTSPGKIEIFLRIEDTGTTAVTLYAYGTVKRTDTGEIVNPGTPIPNVEELQQAAADCIAATEAIIATGAISASVSGTTLIIAPVVA